MSDERFLVVIPTYDEIDNLPRIVPRVLEQDPRIDVLVVDDNSPDGTGDLAEEMAGSEPRIHVLHREGKEGLGRAYLAGFRWGLEGGYDLLFEMDADLSHEPSSLPDFIETAEAADVVVGSRYVGGRVTVINWPLSRLFLSVGANMYASLVTGLPLKDCTGGYKCFRRSTLEVLPLDRVKSDGYGFQIELNYHAWKRGLRVREIPIIFTDRVVGESKMSRRIIWEATWMVWRLRLFGGR